MSNSNSEIGARVKTKRKELKINQKAMSTALGVSQPEVSNIEKGKRNLSDERVSKLCEVLQVTKAFLLTGSSETEAATPPATATSAA
jgi:transcriptional regulator with XRE-family HTH domain